MDTRKIITTTVVETYEISEDEIVEAVKKHLGLENSTLYSYSYNFETGRNYFDKLVITRSRTTTTEEEV